MNAPLQQTASQVLILNTFFLTGATLAPPEVIETHGRGIRVNLRHRRRGLWPKMRGRLRTVGGDWLLLRPDGVGLLDVRATMELDNGALIYTTYGGRGGFGTGRLQPLLKGILPPARTCESFQGITRAIRTICGSTACNVLVRRV